MKILAIITLIFTTFGYVTPQVTISEAKMHLDEVQPMMEAALFNQLDEKKFTSEIHNFNQYLSKLSTTTNNAEIQKYIEIQTKANNARLIALNTNNSDQITESARLQYEASTLYNKLTTSE